MGLRADLGIVGGATPLRPMVDANLGCEGKTVAGIFDLYSQRFVMPQYIIYIGLSFTCESLQGVFIKRAAYGEIAFQL